MFLSSRVSCLPSLCSCTVTGAWMCISAFSTTDSSLYRGGGVWVGGHTQRGPSGKMGEAGGGDWMGGVIGLPGCDLIRHNLLFPRQPLRSPSSLPLLSLTARKQDHDTKKHLQWIHHVALKYIHYMYSSQNRAEQNKDEQTHESKTHTEGKTVLCNFQYTHADTLMQD